jgi:predicted GIY-YIG superfamily endonuclease
MPETTPTRRRSREPVVTYVYRFWDHDDTLLYVGVTANLETRFKDHSGKHWWPQASHSTVEAHPNRALALVAEATAIMDENPLHNIQRPSLERLELLKSRALGRPGAEISPYDPVAILARAHERADGLEADLRKVRAELTRTKAELAQASEALRTHNTLRRPSQYQQVVIDDLREQLAVSVAIEREATKRAEKAERDLAREKLRRMVAAGRPGAV